MYNPLVKLTPALLKSMLATPKLFVRQTYVRGISVMDEPNSISLLFTHYAKDDSIEKNRADIHIAQLQKDPYCFLYNSEDVNHRERLQMAAAAAAPYLVYTNLLYQQWKAPPWLRKKIHTYMLLNYTWWNYSNSNQLQIHLKDRYGLLYLQLSWKAHKADLLLEEIENFIPCATT
ncbi:MAG: hypothetical protein WD135_04630 [Ferruginibacter sp.]